MSAQHFEVGEVAIFHRPGYRCHGLEAIILQPLQWVEHGGVDSKGDRVEPCMAYWCRSELGEAWTKPEHLRKKRPPRDDLEVVRWADVPGGDVIARPAKVLA